MTDISFYATPDAVRTALAEARKNWATEGLGEDMVTTAELVLAEALNNVVEHAHAGRLGGQVVLKTNFVDGALECVIRDDGVPMPGLKMPKGRLPDRGRGLRDLPEGGFGWYMIKSMTDGLAYERRGGWNQLDFVISF